MMMWITMQKRKRKTNENIEEDDEIPISGGGPTYNPDLNHSSSGLESNSQKSIKNSDSQKSVLSNKISSGKEEEKITHDLTRSKSKNSFSSKSNNETKQLNTSDHNKQDEEPQLLTKYGKIESNNNILGFPMANNYDYSGNVFFSDAIAVLGGTYTSGNSEYGNSLNMTINGGTFESEIGNALTIYALGRVEQDLNLTINGGTFNGKEISVAIETPETLELIGPESDIAEYSKVNNDVKVVITDGSYSSNVESLVADGYKVVENNGLYTVQPNLVIATDDEDVTFESDEPLPNDYKLVVEEEELANEEAVMDSVNKQINTALEEVKEELLDSKLVATYDISVKDSSDQVVKLANGNYAISIKVTEDQVKGYNAFKVVYINDEGEVVEVLDAVFEEGAIKFETTHLSTYAIIGYNTVTLTEDGDDVIGDGTDTPTNPEIPGEETPEVPQTFDSLVTYVAAGVVSIIAIVGSVIYIKRKQTN